MYLSVINVGAAKTHEKSRLRKDWISRVVVKTQSTNVSDEDHRLILPNTGGVTRWAGDTGVLQFWVSRHECVAFKSAFAVKCSKVFTISHVIHPHNDGPHG